MGILVEAVRWVVYLTLCLACVSAQQQISQSSPGFLWAIDESLVPLYEESCISVWPLWVPCVQDNLMLPNFFINSLKLIYILITLFFPSYSKVLSGVAVFICYHHKYLKNPSINTTAFP